MESVMVTLMVHLMETWRERRMEPRMEYKMETRMVIPRVIQLDQLRVDPTENLMDASKEHPTVIAMAY